MTVRQPLDVKSLFGKALELPTPTERAAFLDEACAANPALRREVEGLAASPGQGRRVHEAARGRRRRPSLSRPWLSAPAR